MDSVASTNATTQINHGDPNLVCKPATWWSVMLFFLINYLAHCFTVRSFPGESTYDQLVAVVISLMFPSAGMIRAVDGIVRHSRFLWRHRHRGGELGQAARSGALLMVIRGKYWRPAVGDTIRGIRFQRLWGGIGRRSLFRKAHDHEKDTNSAIDPALDRVTEFADDVRATLLRRYDQRGEDEWSGIPINEDEADYDTSRTDSYAYYVLGPPWLNESLRVERLGSTDPERRVVHGSYKLPEGYELASVPTDAEVVSYYQEAGGSDAERHSKPPVVSSSYSAAKSLLGIVQAVSAGYSVYRARGDQIERYGYAAFGLTVTPYLVMSILNSLADALTPSYAALYLVRSEEMEEAERRDGCYFDGVVGHLSRGETGDNRLQSDWQVISADHDKSSSWLERIPTDNDTNTSNLPTRIEAYHFGSKIVGRNFLINALTSGKSITVPSCNKFKKTSPPSRTAWSMQPHGKSLNSQLPLNFISPLAISFIPLTINGVMSKFRAEGSTTAQRGWTMSWFAVGMLSGVFMASLGHEAPVLFQIFYAYLSDVSTWSFENAYMAIEWIALVGVFFAPAVGGLVIVGQMLVEYGNCKYVGGYM